METRITRRNNQNRQISLNRFVNQKEGRAHCQQPNINVKRVEKPTKKRNLKQMINGSSTQQEQIHHRRSQNQIAAKNLPRNAKNKGSQSVQEKSAGLSQKSSQPVAVSSASDDEIYPVGAKLVFYKDKDQNEIKEKYVLGKKAKEQQKQSDDLDKLQFKLLMSQKNKEAINPNKRKKMNDPQTQNQLALQRTLTKAAEKQSQQQFLNFGQKNKKAGQIQMSKNGGKKIVAHTCDPTYNIEQQMQDVKEEQQKINKAKLSFTMRCQDLHNFYLGNSSTFKTKVQKLRSLLRPHISKLVPDECDGDQLFDKVLEVFAGHKRQQNSPQVQQQNDMAQYQTYLKMYGGLFIVKDDPTIQRLKSYIDKFGSKNETEVLILVGDQLDDTQFIRTFILQNEKSLELDILKITGCAARSPQVMKNALINSQHASVEQKGNQKLLLLEDVDQLFQDELDCFYPQLLKLIEQTKVPIVLTTTDTSLLKSIFSDSDRKYWDTCPNYEFAYFTTEQNPDKVLATEILIHSMEEMLSTEKENTKNEFDNLENWIGHYTNQEVGQSSLCQRLNQLQACRGSHVPPVQTDLADDETLEDDLDLDLDQLCNSLERQSFDDNFHMAQVTHKIPKNKEDEIVPRRRSQDFEIAREKHHLLRTLTLKNSGPNCHQLQSGQQVLSFSLLNQYASFLSLRESQIISNLIFEWLEIARTILLNKRTQRGAQTDHDWQIMLSRHFLLNISFDMDQADFNPVERYVSLIFKLPELQKEQN